MGVETEISSRNRASKQQEKSGVRQLTVQHSNPQAKEGMTM